MRRGLLQRRVAATGVAAVFFLIESFNPDSLKPRDPSWTLFVQTCIGLLGIAWIAQCYILAR